MVNANMLVVHHSPCADGFTAAWAVRQANPDAQFFSGVYGEMPPDVTGKDVVLVDFSYKRPVLEKMLEECKSLTVLDHHKSAREDLKELSNPKLTVVFDMEHSGAKIAWDYFHPNVPAPQVLLHVEDRDLWRFSLPGTKEINATIFSYDYTFENWDELMKADAHVLYEQGVALERKAMKDTLELIKSCSRLIRIGDYIVPVANIPFQFASEAGNIMSVGKPFAATYFDGKDGRKFSLRSQEDGIDVSEVAAKYQGGGHVRAAGFKQIIGWEGEA